MKYTDEEVQACAMIALQQLAEAHRQGRSVGSINRKVMELANENDSLRPNKLSTKWRAVVLETAARLRVAL
jgi:hypothetical protein